MTRHEILMKADEIVNGNREQGYGSPENNFLIISTFWDIYLNEKYDFFGTITETDVAMMMILLKIARCITGKNKDDNYIDIAGYAACAGEIASDDKLVDELVTEAIEKAKERCRGWIDGLYKS